MDRAADFESACGGSIPPGATLRAVLAVAVGLVLVLTACGGDGRGAAADEAGPVHVHGLGINPRDGALFIATHTGLWRVERGAREAERVGDRHQDTMGFTVVGPDHFLGSGHPDARDDLPPHLGLIESRDAGMSWEPISLLGEADFHVLRANGTRVVGYDATGGRLMTSRDSGRSWQAVVPPAPLFDLAADPGDARRLLASTELGLLLSRDEGRTWAPVARRAGLIDWPARNRLYLVEGSGRVLTSQNASEWRRVGSIGAEPAALLAHSERELYVALHDGTIKVSRDGGRSWSVRSTA